MNKKQLKIAVFHNLPSGGAKRSLYTYIQYLTQQGHIVDVFIPETANEEYLPLESVANSVVKYDVKPSFFREKIYSIFSYVPAIIKRVSVNNVMETEKKIAEDLNDSGYDIVYCEQDQFTMTPVIFKYLTKPSIYYCAQPIRNEQILKKVNNQKTKAGIFNHPLIRPFANIFVNNVETRDYERDIEFAEYSTNLLTNSYFTHENILRQYGLPGYETKESTYGANPNSKVGIGHPNCKHIWTSYWSQEQIQDEKYDSAEWEGRYKTKQKIQSLELEKSRLLTDRRIYKSLEQQDLVDKTTERIKTIRGKIKKLEE